MKSRIRSSVSVVMRPPLRRRLASFPSFTARRPNVDSARPACRQNSAISCRIASFKWRFLERLIICVSLPIGNQGENPRSTTNRPTHLVGGTYQGPENSYFCIPAWAGLRARRRQQPTNWVDEWAGSLILAIASRLVQDRASLPERSPMPRFSANLGHLFPEYPLIERIGAAATAGFGAIELQLPYDVAPGAVKAEIDRHGLTMLNI